MDGFRIAAAYVEVDADTSKADAKVDALIAKLGVISGDTATARVRVDGADEAAAAAAKVQAALDAIRASQATARVRVDTTGAAPAIAGVTFGVRGLFGAVAALGRLKVPLFGGGSVFGLSLPAVLAAAGGVHLLADAIVETTAVVIPATIALASFGVAAVPTVQAITAHMKDLQTVADATGQSVYPLTGAFSRMADAVKPEVYQLFGDALVIAGKKGDAFTQLAAGTGRAVDSLATRFTMAVTSGHGFTTFMSHAVTDVAQLGDIIGNIGGAIGHILSVVPAYANVLLTAADATSKFAEQAVAVAQPVIGAGLAFHGAFLYTGLLATGIAKLASGGLGLVANMALGAAAKVERFGAAGEQAAGGLLSFAAGAERAAALPWGWIAVAAAGIGFLAYRFITARDAADGFIASVNQRLSVTPLAQVTGAISSSISVMNTRLSAAKISLGQFSGGALATGRALAPIAPGLQGVAGWMARFSNTVNASVNSLLHYSLLATNAGEATKGSAIAAAGAVHDYQAYKAEIDTLTRQSATFRLHLGELSVMFGSSAAAIGILTAAGVTAKQMMDGSIASWVQVMTQVQATTDAYRAMGVTGGILQSDLNALTLAASDQVTAMTKVNQAWDTVIGITSGGQAAFITFQQDILSVNQAFAQTGGTGRTVTQTFAAASAAAKAAGASMTGLNAPSLQLRATWQTAYTGGAKLLDALRMMTSISPQAAGATALLTSAARDVTAQLIGFGKESGATRAQLLQMVQEVNPGITTFAGLTKWLGNTKNAGHDLNSVVAKLGTNLHDLQAAAQSVSQAVSSQMNTAIAAGTLKVSGFSAAWSKTVNDLKTGASKTTIATDSLNLFNIMTGKLHMSVPQANADLLAMGLDIQKIPTHHSTTITVDTRQASANIGALLTQMDEIHSKSVQISVTTIQHVLHGMAGGGVVPGYAPGVDDRLIAVGPGEGILVPEAVRGIGGPPAVHELNRKYGGARVARGNKTGAFASGGITTSANAHYGFLQDTFNIGVNVTSPPAGGGNMKALFDYWMAHYAAYRQAHQNIYGGLTGQALFRYWETHWQTWIRDNLFRAGGTGGTITGAGPSALPAIGAGIIKALDGTASQIGAAIKSLTAEVLKAYNTGTISGKTGSYLTNLLSQDNATLKMLVTDRQALVKEIAAANAYAKNVEQSAVSWASLGEAQTLSGAKKVSAASIAAGLGDALHMITAFAGAIRKLAKEGLNKTLLSQIIQMGPGPDGLAYARALEAATPAQLAKINSEEAGILRQSKFLGQTAADAFYGLGEGTGKGFLKGLKDSLKQVDSIMEQIIRQLIAKLKKDLKIKSPSEVMAEIGVQIPAGLAAGMRAGMREVDDAAGAMTGWSRRPQPRRAGGIGTYGQDHSGCRDIVVNFIGTKYPTPEQLHALNLGLTMAVANA